MVTKKLTVAVVGLAALTLVGFVIVSSLFGTRRIDNSPDSPPPPQPTVTAKPQALVLPSPQTNKVNQTEGQLRSDLGQAQTLLEQMNTAISNGDWTDTQNKFAEFKYKTQRMPAPQLNHPDISPVLQDFFALYKVQLARSITEQNALQAKLTVNQLFGIVSEQRARFGIRSIPLEFQRLIFLIREIELWGQLNDEEMMRLRIGALRDAWRDVRPVIVARRNGTDQGKHFDELVEKLSGAGQSQEIASLIPELNKEFDRMNGLFQRLARPVGTSSIQPKPTDDD